MTFEFGFNPAGIPSNPFGQTRQFNQHPRKFVSVGNLSLRRDPNGEIEKFKRIGQVS
jgi:hypothetical protein